MESENEHRKFSRTQISLPISIACGEEQTLFLADIEDLTVEGLSFISEKPIAKGAGLYVLFPAGGALKENEVPAEVIRCQELAGKGPRAYKVAVRFIEMNDTYLMDALALIHGRRPKS